VVGVSAVFQSLRPEEEGGDERVDEVIASGSVFGRWGRTCAVEVLLVCYRCSILYRNDSYGS